MKTIVSFSGGRTSAYISRLLLDSKERDDLIFVFMNTGVEHPKTLEFVHECDKRWNLNLVWIESVTQFNKRKSSMFKVVDYKTATRDESLFVNMCKKYGLPNVTYLHCTRELKINPFNNYLKSLELGEYKTAIGIRYDEIDRIPEDFTEKGFTYPLADKKITKKDVEEYWDNQEFSLDLSHQLGNCTFCYKKSPKRLLENIKEMPSIYKQVRNIEKSCGKGGRKMFRKNLNIDELIEFAKTAKKKDMLKSGDCADQCEMF